MGGDAEGPSDEADTAPVADVGSEDEDAAPAPRQAPREAPAKRPAQTFGSVWDSQIGMPAPGTAVAAGSGTGPILDDEDLDEPPIPEYLIAERRQGNVGRGGPVGRSGPGLGPRAGYSSAVDRERFGGGRGSPSRFAEPTPRGGRGVDRPRDDRPRDDRPRPDRGIPRPPRLGSSDEPWSEVPPELEAMLRAQMGNRPSRPIRPAEVAASTPPVPDGGSAVSPDAPPARAPRGRGTRTAAPKAEVAAPTADAQTPNAAAPKRRATRTAAPKAAAVPAEPAAEAAAPKRRATRKPAPEAASAADAPALETASPKRRVTRKKADAADA